MFTVIAIVCIAYTVIDLGASIYLIRTNPVYRARFKSLVSMVKGRFLQKAS